MNKSLKRGYAKFFSHAALGALLLAPSFVIGSFGRIVADEYCMCLAALGLDPVSATLSVYETWSGALFGFFLQSVFSHWLILNVSQGFASAVSLVFFQAGLWFAVYQLMRLPPTQEAQPRKNPYLVSGISASLLISALLVPPYLPEFAFLEFITQQNAVGSLMLRYPGIVASLGGSFVLIGLLMFLNHPGAGSIRFSKIGGLALVGLAAGLSDYLFAAFVSAASLVIGLMRSPPKLTAALSMVLPVWVGLLAGLSLSLFSPGALQRREALSASTSNRTGLYDLYNLLADPFWTTMTIVSYSGFLVAGVSFFWGLAARQSHPQPASYNFKLPQIAGLVICTLFMQALAGLATYSAPWHVLLPRILLLIALMYGGYIYGQKISRRMDFSAQESPPKILVAAKSVPLAVLSILIILVYSGAKEIPEKWRAGALPVMGISLSLEPYTVFGDTETQMWADCYFEIEEYLKEKKESPN